MVASPGLDFTFRTEGKEQTELSIVSVSGVPEASPHTHTPPPADSGATGSFPEGSLARLHIFTQCSFSLCVLLGMIG